MTRNFFELQGAVPDLDEQGFFSLVKSRKVVIRDRLYRPEVLRSELYPLTWRVKRKTFRNISFSKTLIENFEFSDCKFVQCLFLGTSFRHCRFSNCHFIDSNPYRIEFDNVFIDPRSFERCLDVSAHQNLGVYLYQELLRNSRSQSQSDFADEARYRFKQWQRFLLEEEIIAAPALGYEVIAKRVKIALSWLFEKVLGSGVKLTNFTLSFLGTLLFWSLLNWFCRYAFGLVRDHNVIKSFIDSLYFSTVTMTTVGFGDIVPTTRLGEFVVCFEAITGFFFFATLASMLYHRITS